MGPRFLTTRIRKRSGTALILTAFALLPSCNEPLSDSRVEGKTLKPATGPDSNSTGNSKPSDSSSPDTGASGEHPSCGNRPCLQIPPNTKLCQIHRNNSGARFEGLFRYKAELELNKGLFPPDKIRLDGVIRGRSQSMPFSSQSSVFSIEKDEDEGPLAAMIDGILHTENGQRLEVELTLTPKAGSGKHGLFVLDSFESLDASRESKSLRLFSAEPIPWMGNAKSSLFTACALVEETQEPFVFLFKDGSSIELSVRSRMSTWIGSFQTGVLSRAVGTFQGQALDISERTMLGYSSKHHTDFLRIPTLAIRYASGDHESGACGIGFEPTSDASRPYKAHLLDCDNEPIKELALSSATYPDRYELIP